MSAAERRDGFDVRTIRSPDGAARASFLPELGGIGFSLVLATRAGPRELLFTHDFLWDRAAERTRGGWPLLFPICGRLERDGEADAYLFAGERRRLPIHGFSLRVPWEVVGEAGADRLTLRLRESARTLDRYPFPFDVTLDYRIGASSLTCVQTVANRGDAPMPYYAGFHPYFLTPPPGAGKDEVRVDLRAEERWLYNARLTDVVGRAPATPFPAGIGAPGVNESLHRVAPDSVSSLTFPDGPVLRLRVSGEAPYPFVQLYTMPDKPFFCVEPWMSHPNALNTCGAARLLPPGASERAVAEVWVEG